jgi:hypothetical protein
LPFLTEMITILVGLKLKTTRTRAITWLQSNKLAPLRDGALHDYKATNKALVIM